MPSALTPLQEAALAGAVEHMNRGEYRLAVDEFEAAYHEVEGRERAPWLAFIRSAAALHHWGEGHPHSARRLYRSARDLLAKLPSRWEGVDVERFAAELEAAFAPLLAGGVAPPPSPRRWLEAARR